MFINDFDYKLPKELIAQFPLEKRDHSRLMVIYRSNYKIEHKRFFNVIEYLQRGDILIINDTKVFNARLYGEKPSGGKIEFLLLNKLRETKGESIWNSLIKTFSGNPRIGLRFNIDSIIMGEILERVSDIEWKVIFKYNGNFNKILEKIGYPPLPPYIKRNGDLRYRKMDKKRYQTEYAENIGSIAAPTAGFHFTEVLLNKIREKGIIIAPVTLHIGYGTFAPIKVDRIEDHKMHREFYEIPESTVSLIENNNRRIIGVGTTVVRVIETYMNTRELKGYTDLFIYPPYKFKRINGMITNFHLPKSTLLLLVSAFAGRKLILNAYEKGIKERYRFYSYGDSMLIL